MSTESSLWASLATSIPAFIRHFGQRPFGALPGTSAPTFWTFSFFGRHGFSFRHRMTVFTYNLGRTAEMLQLIHIFLGPLNTQVSACQCGKQACHFFINLIVIADCLGDLIPQQSSIPLPHTVYGYPHSGPGHVQFAATSS